MQSDAEDDDDDDSEARMFGYIQPGELVTGNEWGGANESLGRLRGDGNRRQLPYAPFEFLSVLFL